jgi:hypothetical protein
MPIGRNKNRNRKLKTIESKIPARKTAIEIRSTNVEAPY